MLTRRHLALLFAALCCTRICHSAAVSEYTRELHTAHCTDDDSYGDNGNDNDWTSWPAYGGTRSRGSCNDQAVLPREYLSRDDNSTRAQSTKSTSIATRILERRQTDLRPTPQPTGTPSHQKTVHITSATDFALLLPGTAGELISDAESDGVAYCTSSSTDPSCTDRPHLPADFVLASAMHASDDGAWIQVTGCMDSAKFHFKKGDEGGQFDVRFPNGAQCTFGGYAASFIELVEPALNRFCLRCCASANDQTHCNSHQDRTGCTTAVPGQYDFPDLGVSCS
ncbi:hypothetical protein BDW22DRAFT_1338742 [Trametopsis cervina]|nr:hypothetical protein BDW22DRAFT_1338742 [Trametopsis cervina]